MSTYYMPGDVLVLDSALKTTTVTTTTKFTAVISTIYGDFLNVGGLGMKGSREKQLPLACEYQIL